MWFFPFHFLPNLVQCVFFFFFKLLTIFFVLILNVQFSVCFHIFYIFNILSFLRFSFIFLDVCFPWNLLKYLKCVFVFCLMVLLSSFVLPPLHFTSWFFTSDVFYFLFHYRYCMVVWLSEFRVFRFFKSDTSLLFMFFFYYLFYSLTSPCSDKIFYKQLWTIRQPLTWQVLF